MGMKPTSAFKNSLAHYAAFCPSPKDYRNIVDSADSIVVIVWNDEKDATLEVFRFNQTLSSISALFPQPQPPVFSIAPLNLDGLVIMLNNNVTQVTNVITTQEDLDDILFRNLPATEYKYNDTCNNSFDVLVMQ